MGSAAIVLSPLCRVSPSSIADTLMGGPSPIAAMTILGGGRPSSLERNVLRYRAIEATLYLFYAAEVRDFILTNIFPLIPPVPGAGAWETAAESRRKQLLRTLVESAERAGAISRADAEALTPEHPHDPKEGKKLRRAFAHAVALGIFEPAEADELVELLGYRNDVAHHIQLVLADVSRAYWNSEYLAFAAPRYKSTALDRLRGYRESLWRRTQNLLLSLSLNGLLFDYAEHVFEAELIRLDRRIKAQIAEEQARFDALRPELDLQGTELVDDLEPRAPWNFRPAPHEGQASGHLTPRGVEICYRLFDLGKSPLAVSYLMGFSLRAAQYRKRRWREIGGPGRIRAEVKRYSYPRRTELPSGSVIDTSKADGPPPANPGH